MCKWRSVRICCHDSPHAEAIGSHLRLFHTVSEGEFSEVGGGREERPQTVNAQSLVPIGQALRRAYREAAGAELAAQTDRRVTARRCMNSASI
jgi:hypothetical protein